MVAYERFQLWGFDLEKFGVLVRWSLKVDGRLPELVAHGDSTVHVCKKKKALLIMVRFSKQTGHKLRFKRI